MWRADTLEKTLMLGKIEGRWRAWQRMKWLDDTTDRVDMSLSKLWEILTEGEAWHAALCGLAKMGPDWVTEQQQQQPWAVSQQEVHTSNLALPLKNQLEEFGRARRRCLPIILFYDAPDSFKIESVLAERCTWHQEGPWVRPNMVKQDDWPETTWKLTRFTIKAEAARHVAEHPSCIPLHYCLSLGAPAL